MSIPKIIHYCWFGLNEKPAIIKKCINSWGILEGFEIKEWNEQNFDVNSHPYIKEAYKKKKYAFVSDYVRLKVLHEYGGIYLDTDVEVKKDLSLFLKNNFFIGFMYDSLLGTAVIGSNPNNKILVELLSNYNNKQSTYDEANNNFITKYFLDNYKEFRLNNKYQVLEKEISVYPKEYFERPTYSKEMGFTEHHYTATWKNKNKFLNLTKKIPKVILGNVLYKKITAKRSLKYTPFYDIYLIHQKIEE